MQKRRRSYTCGKRRWDFAYQEVLLPWTARMISFTRAHSMIPKLSARDAMTTNIASIGRFLHMEHQPL